MSRRPRSMLKLSGRRRRARPRHDARPRGQRSRRFRGQAPAPERARCGALVHLPAPAPVHVDHGERALRRHRRRRPAAVRRARHGARCRTCRAAAGRDRRLGRSAQPLRQAPHDPQSVGRSRAHRAAAAPPGRSARDPGPVGGNRHHRARRAAAHHVEPLARGARAQVRGRDEGHALVGRSSTSGRPPRCWAAAARRTPCGRCSCSEPARATRLRGRWRTVRSRASPRATRSWSARC